MITTDLSHLEIVCKMHIATSALLQTPSLLLFPHFAAQLCAHFASHALLTHGFCGRCSPFHSSPQQARS